MPSVTVILTSFNHEKYIREAIDSVLNQSFTDFELIILDDTSSDGSWELINKYSDQRIRAFRYDERSASTMDANKAIAEMASGRYIAIHHSDDIWEPNKLELQVAFLERHSDIGAVFTKATIIGEDGLPLADRSHYYWGIFDQPNKTRHEWLRFFFKTGNALCHPSVLIRRTCYDDIGFYQPGLWQLPDFDLWIRLCLNYEIYIIQENLVRFRARDNDANSSGDRPDTRIRSAYETYWLLRHYRKITRFSDLIMIFPSAREYYRAEKTDTGFALGMIALEESSHPAARLFGQDLLFEALGDPDRARNIKDQYDFDELSFRAVTGRHDVFSIVEAATLRQAVATRDGQITDLAHSVAERDGQIASLAHSVAERDGQIASLAHSVAERDGQIASLTHSVAERDGQIANLAHSVAERDREIARLEELIQEIHRSRSWRVTAPLRSATSALRNMAGATRRRNRFT